jgi:hypothetical protein
MHRQYYGICVVKTVYACKLHLHGQSKTVYAKARGGHGPHMLIQKQNVKCVPSFSLSFALFTDVLSFGRGSCLHACTLINWSALALELTKTKRPNDVAMSYPFSVVTHPMIKSRKYKSSSLLAVTWLRLTNNKHPVFGLQAKHWVGKWHRDVTDQC